MIGFGEKLRLGECPRDAMQGIREFIPTDKKADYIRALLRVGFDVLDFGSFVSPAAIPQLRDTSEVLAKIEDTDSATRLLSIVGNVRYAAFAAHYERIEYLGYPFSVSEIFLQKNMRSDFDRSWENILGIQRISQQKKKKLLVYLSMAFGNPYQEAWNTGIVEEWVDRLDRAGVRHIHLADTIGVSAPGDIRILFAGLIPRYPHIEFGFHLHTLPDKWEERVWVAFKAGCRRFDSVMMGVGGCPFTSYQMVGNLDTLSLIHFLDRKGVPLQLDRKALQRAGLKAGELFGTRNDIYGHTGTN